VAFIVVSSYSRFEFAESATENYLVIVGWNLASIARGDFSRLGLVVRMSDFGTTCAVAPASAFQMHSMGLSMIG